MKTFHVFFGTDAVRDAAVVAKKIEKDSVVVVSPGKEIEDRFVSIIENQLVRKMDSSSKLKELKNYFLSFSADEEYHSEVERISGIVASLLSEGMSLTFMDNSLTNYLKAFLTIMCAKCMGTLIGVSTVVDGRDFVLCENSNGIPVVDWHLTEQKIKSLDTSCPIMVAGAYGRKVQGDTVDLGKRGSELTANIIGSVLNVESVCFLVPGIEYEGVSLLTYEEAAQRFSSGYPIYPPAILPAKKRNVPISILDLNKDGENVLDICSVSDDKRTSGITGVMCSDPMTLFTVYGTGLLGSIGISSAIFGVLAKSGLNIHFISQASSEYSISFAVKRKVAKKAEDALRTLIMDTYKANYNDLSFSSKEVKIVSVFGYRMRNVPGISGKVYSALGNAAVNVIAASQGGEELSISIVVSEKDADKASAALSNI